MAAVTSPLFSRFVQASATSTTNHLVASMLFVFNSNAVEDAVSSSRASLHINIVSAYRLAYEMNGTEPSDTCD